MGYFLYAHHQLWKTQEELPYGLGKLGKRFLEGLKLVAHLTHFMVATWYCKNVVITDLDFGVGEIRRNRGNKEGSDLGLIFGRWTLDAHNFIYFIFWKKKKVRSRFVSVDSSISNFKFQMSRWNPHFSLPSGFGGNESRPLPPNLPISSHGFSVSSPSSSSLAPAASTVLPSLCHTFSQWFFNYFYLFLLNFPKSFQPWICMECYLTPFFTYAQWQT